MRKTSLLVALASLFFLFFILMIQSQLEQSSTASVPSIPTENTETTFEQSSILDLNDQESEAIASQVQTFPIQSNPSAKYYDLNSDYVGWLKIGGTVIDYPVVKSSDNKFYLNHDFYKDEHILGAIFMDYRNIGMGQDDHTILYGHYTQSGLMFAELDKFLSESFTNKNPTINFMDPYTKRTYKIFSVHVAEADSNYIKTSFKEDDLKKYAEKLKANSAYPIDSELKESPKLITLISCNYSVDDGRVYVHAYEITE